MGIGLSEALLLVSGGCLVFSSLAIIHFVSTYNPHNRSLAFFSAFAIGVAAFYMASISTNHSKLESLEIAMTSSIMVSNRYSLLRSLSPMPDRSMHAT